MEKRKTINTFFIVGVFAIAMGFFEAVLVVYLRELFYPQGFAFPLSKEAVRILSIELLREAATMVMLVCVAILAGKNRLQRFAYFLYTFAVWDIFYYIGLKLTLNWPESLLTWDILFLIPIIWVGPVLAPVICSLSMITLASCIIFFQEKGYTVVLRKTEWALLLLGAFIIFCTFVWDFSTIIIREGLLTKIFTLTRSERFLQILAEYVPTHFNWLFFTIGELLIVIGIVSLVWKTKMGKGLNNGSG